MQIVHGLGDHSGLHRHLVNHLLEHGYAAHAVDLRGHGRSAGQRAYVRDWFDYHNDVLALTDRLMYRNAVQRVTLIGSSMGALLALDLPILVGASRKSFLQTAVGECPARERDPASVAAATVAVLSGAHIVRVHDVPGSVQAVRVADMISAAAEPGLS